MEKVPFLTECLPWSNVLGTDRRLFRKFRKTDNGLFQKGPKLRRVDLLERMHANLDLLPRPAERFHFHPRLVAIDRQVGQLVQRLELDSLLQLVALERAAIDAEFEL